MNRNQNENNEPELAACVRRMMEQYFSDLDGERPGSIYDMVVASVEKPLIEVILQRAEGNQTRAAELLGINRNTLRKKMNAYSID